MYDKTELIYKEDARRIIDSPRSREQMLNMLDNIPTADAIDKVLENIHQEVKEYYINNHFMGERYCTDVLQIINKYR